MFSDADMNAIDASLPPSMRGSSGPARRELHTQFVCEASRADVLLLLSTPSASRARPLQEIRQPHHRLARLLAQGMRPIEVSRQTGYSVSRISMLQADPAFRELIYFYKNAAHEAFIDVHEMAAEISCAALDELRTRLESEPDSFTNAEIMKAAALLMDRTGHGPTRQVNVSNSGSVIQELKEKREEQRDFAVLEPDYD